MFIHGERDISIRHTLGGPKRLAEAKRILKRARNYFDELAGTLEGLGNKPLMDDELERFLLAFWPDPERNDDLSGNPDSIENIQEAISKPRKSRSAVKREKVAKLFGNDHEWGGTQLGAYLAVCEFVDQDANIKSSTKGHSAEECRLDNIWFGSGGKTKETAMKTILSWS